MKHLIPVAAACALLLSGGSAHAVKNYNCKEASCSYTYKLGRSVTQEFRGTCDGKLPKSKNNQKCSSSSSGVTCTGTWHVDLPSGKYDTCSCTNWDPVTQHNAKISLKCP